MKAIKNIYFVRRTLFVLFLIVSVGYASKSSVSDEFADRRLTAGAKIFRALLAADLDIASKTGEGGNLRLCILYTNDMKNAELVARTLTSRDDTRIRKLEVITEILPQDSCMVNDEKERFAGIFLTQNLSDTKLHSLLASAFRQKTVVFSPLEGDVERGVLGGLAVEARVRPYLNMKALNNAEVQLNPFFMRVSKKYEE